MRTHTKGSQASMTPEKPLQFLREGNQRFVNNLKANRDLLQQINGTNDGQFPFATIFSCIDSRTSAELVFDQRLGDIFSIRIAGNFVNEDIFGSMEFGRKIAGSKILVVLGHSQCGAIKWACDNVSLGNLAALIQKLRPAVSAVPALPGERCSQNAEFVQAVAQENVHLTVAEILERSPILREMNQKKEIGIVGGLHDTETGQITFFGYRQDEVRGERRCPLGWSCSVIVPIRRLDSSLAD